MCANLHVHLHHSKCKSVSYHQISKTLTLPCYMFPNGRHIGRKCRTPVVQETSLTLKHIAQKNNSPPDRRNMLLKPHKNAQPPPPHLPENETRQNQQFVCRARSESPVNTPLLEIKLGPKVPFVFMRRVITPISIEPNGKRSRGLTPDHKNQPHQNLKLCFRSAAWQNPSHSPKSLLSLLVWMPE